MQQNHLELTIGRGMPRTLLYYHVPSMLDVSPPVADDCMFFITWTTITTTTLVCKYSIVEIVPCRISCNHMLDILPRRPD